MTLQKNVKSRVFLDFQKNVKTYSRTMVSVEMSHPAPPEVDESSKREA